MKKKFLAVVAAVSMMAVAAFGCGKGSSGTDYSKYVTVGEYKGIEVTDIDTSVSDDELNAKIATMFREVVEKGDVVNLDFDGYINGETFEGGSTDEDGYDLEIGSGAFIDGFEDGLIGVKVGEEVSLDLKFPEDYNEAYAGKDV
ncbi:MAG: FKBP-type peptidyl-prolyl cis-trans isomerase, partial [Lachnospiraceae bacterium]|nr:FKBP-type peptidyl-prolyl cis-trans isomerase [Lachnospiraceae bacterium]